VGTGHGCTSRAVDSSQGTVKCQQHSYNIVRINFKSGLLVVAICVSKQLVIIRVCYSSY